MAEGNAKPPHHPSGISGFGDKDDHVIERRSLRDYYIILRERLWIALPLAIIVAASYAYIQARKPQVFRSTASMVFDRPERLGSDQGIIDTAAQSEADLATEVTILNEGSIHNRVFNTLGDDEIAQLQRAFQQPGQAPVRDQRLLGSVSARHTRGTFIVEVSVDHPDPQGAALIANKFVRQYLQSREDLLSGKYDSGLARVQTTLKTAEADAAEARKKETEFIQSKGITDINNSTSIINNRLATAAAELTAAQGQIAQLKQLLDQVTEYQTRFPEKSTQVQRLLELPQILETGSVKTFKANLEDATREVNRLSEFLLERAPPIRDAVAKQAEAEDALFGEQQRAIVELRNRLTTAERRRDAVEAEKNAAQKESLDLTALHAAYSALKTDADIKENRYRGLLQSEGALTTGQTTQKVALRPLSDASPGYQVQPNVSRAIRTAIGLGLVVFFGVAVGLSFIDDRIKSAWDVEHFIGVNLLGIVPDLSALKEDEKYTLVFNNRQVPGTEAFLGVYSAVKIHSKLDFPKALLVTSTIPGEGKTLISCNLAGSFARHGKRTLLIDCDLRRPMVHRYFNQENTRGLITWFEAGSNLDGNLAEDQSLGIIKLGENFSLLCSGGRSKSPTDLLESPAFGQLIDRLKKHYDLVVIDSPPLGAVTDSMLIAESTDEVIYVCRFNRAYKKHIRVYVKALRNGKNEILGVVLNGLSPRRIEYYSNYRYYRSYKKYYGSQT